MKPSPAQRLDRERPADRLLAQMPQQVIDAADWLAVKAEQHITFAQARPRGWVIGFEPGHEDAKILIQPLEAGDPAENGDLMPSNADIPIRTRPYRIIFSNTMRAVFSVTAKQIP